MPYGDYNRYMRNKVTGATRSCCCPTGPTGMTGPTGPIGITGPTGNDATAAGPLYSVQYKADAAGNFGGNGSLRFWPEGSVNPSSLPVTQNIVDVGDVFGGIASAPLPTANTHFVYKSGATGNVYVSFEDTQGVDIQLNKQITQPGDDKFIVSSQARGIPSGGTTGPTALLDNKIELVTCDATTNIHSFRQTNGTDYGAGKVEISTNTGGIALKSLGNNVNGNATPGVGGGPIDIVGNDSDINISTGKTGTTNRHIHTRFIGGQAGAKGLIQPMNSSILVCAEAPASNVASGDVTTVAQGGQINLITRKPVGLVESGPITLVTESDNIDLTAGGTAKKITARNRLEIGPTTGATNIRLDGTAGDITASSSIEAGTTVTAGTSITSGTTITAGTSVTAVTSVTAGTEVAAGTNLIAGGGGNGYLRVNRVNVTGGVALETNELNQIEQTKLWVPLALHSTTSTALDPMSGVLTRLPSEGSIAFDNTNNLLTYAADAPSNAPTPGLKAKYIGNKILLKSVTFTESLSRNNTTAGSVNAPVTNNAAYEIKANNNIDVVGYQSSNKLRNYDTSNPHNCYAIQIGDSQTADGVRDIYCVCVDMPPRKSSNPATPDYSVLVEGVVTLSLKNTTSSSINANCSIGVWATDTATPHTSAAAAVGPLPITSASSWKFGTDMFSYGGGALTWPRAMHASYYTNLARDEVPGIVFNNTASQGPYTQQFPPGWLNTQKTYAYTDPMSQPSSNNHAGNPNNGSPFRIEVDASAYEIPSIPFSILCQNTNTTTAIQKQYIWVTISDLQSPANHTAYVLRDGFYGFTSTTSTNAYGGCASCSVYYIGDPDITGTTSDA